MIELKDSMSLTNAGHDLTGICCDARGCNAKE